MEAATAVLLRLAPLLATVVVSAAVLMVADRILRRHWAGDSEAEYRFQMIMLSLTLASIIAIVLALPIDDPLRCQLLGLLGILFSAAIALSSTTFIGNILAGAIKKRQMRDYGRASDPIDGTDRPSLHRRILTGQNRFLLLRNRRNHGLGGDH